MSLYNTKIEDLKNKIHSHNAMFQLELFKKNLEANVLDNEKLKIFMATLWAFFRETPSGILSLSLRIYDYWNRINQWDAMSKSAYALSTAVDEFGLDNIRKTLLPTHHQLFKETAFYFQVSSEDLTSDKYILSAGKKIGNASKLYYRKKPLSVSLGFHLASELTSWYEFKSFLSGFWKNKQYYKISSQETSPLKFFWIHTLIEPSHLLYSEKIVDEYLKVNPDSIDAIASGAISYLKLYEKLFKQLNKALFIKI